MPAVNLDWNRIQQILGGDKAFENVSGLAGAFLKSKGENDRMDRVQGATNEQTRARLLQDHSQFSAKLAADLAQSRRDDDLRRAVGAMNSTKLGENENFATRNRILSAVLPNMRGGNFTPGDAGVARAMGSRPSPFANGIPAEALTAIGEGATGRAIADRQKMLLNIDPNAPLADFGAMGFDPEQSNFGLEDYQSGLVSARDASNTSVDDAIRRALAQDYEGIMRLPGDPAQEEQKKQGFWSKLGGVLKFAAPIAASFIPGVGPLAAAAIAGGGSTAGSLLQGDSIGQALLSGGMGAASGYGARKLGGPRPMQGRGYGVLR
jgi:hypothetical protein